MRELGFWVKLAGLGALLGTTAFLAVMRVSVRGGIVTMPDLRGLPEVLAVDRLHSLGLDLKVSEQRYSSVVPYGAVIQQSIEPGSALKRGRTIAVVMSIGDKVSEVPQLVGSPSARQAELILEQNGLIPGRADVIPSAQPAGTVLAQSPEAGQQVDRGQGVGLLVSAGPEPPARLMPDLAGLGLAAARSLVGRMGLVLRQVSEHAVPGAVPGSVEAQNVTPYSRVEEGSEIDLTVTPGGAAQVPARLAAVTFTMPNDGVQERRLIIVVRDSLGQRPVYNRMVGPGTLVRRDVRVHGPATATFSVGGVTADVQTIP